MGTSTSWLLQEGLRVAARSSSPGLLHLHPRLQAVNAVKHSSSKFREEGVMKSNALLISTLSCIGATAMTVVMLGQNPAPASPPANAAAAAPQQGPGVQAANDARYRDWVMTQCKNPPAPRGAGGGARAGGAGFGPRGPLTHVDYMVTEIPGVIAAGQKWQTVWTGRGNNADGIIASDDGGILAAQNTDSAVMKIDRNGNVSFPYKDTNTGGALAMSKDGSLLDR